MNIKPILFNTDMVRAILDDRKGITRRIVKGFISDDAIWGYTAFTPKGCISCRGTFTGGYGEKFFKLPCEPGDIIYIRETWCLRYDGEKYFYKADKNTPREEKRLIDYDYVSWHPSIHMPKEAARIWLKVKAVRVERLQCMSWDDICNEGVIPDSDIRDEFSFKMLQNKFKNLWNYTIKKSDIDRYGWDANPWVWVIGFERCEKPEGWRV